MKIKIIDFGAERMPERVHDNDAGADVYAPEGYVIKPQVTAKFALGFGLELPDGFAGYIFPRTSLAQRGIVCELPPIDSGYRGEVHAIVTNNSDEPYFIEKGDRIGQLVITPVILADFVTHTAAKRGTGAFGSTGK